MKKLLAYISAALFLAACAPDKLPSGLVRDDGNIIHIGGMESEYLHAVATPQTKAAERQLAENVVWLRGVVRNGLDITYSNIDAQGRHVVDNEKVAILKWTGERIGSGELGQGIYTFNIKGTSPAVPAPWYDNGPHYFEGQYVPSEIRSSTAALVEDSDLTTDQSDDRDHEYDSAGNSSGEIGNYTKLAHYIGMPPNWTAAATVDKILLPFKHRLCRVVCYVLIDPKLQADGVTLRGYKRNSSGVYDSSLEKDDPNTTVFRMGKVKVLDHVHEIHHGAGEADDLVPIWTEARKVTPHFLDELSASVDVYGAQVYNGSNANAITAANEAFIVYIRNKDDKKFYPTTDGWSAIHEEYVRGMAGNTASQEAIMAKYEQKAYTVVPRYDIICRPTYTSLDEVMYDEAGYYHIVDGRKVVDEFVRTSLLNQKNKIEFSMTLSSGLNYAKDFEFDLNANMQTIVYLSVDMEDVDYDESVPIVWTENPGNDLYYGVDNDLGHNMSRAGSSWQRALRFSDTDASWNVTDGNYYQDDYQNKGESGQYFKTADPFVEQFAKAYRGGDRHGDYFILDKPLAIDARMLPDNFVFTGHLDGRGHTITLTHSGEPVYKDAENITAQLYTRTGSSLADWSYTAWSIPEHLYVKLVTPVYYKEEELEYVGDVSYVRTTLTFVPEQTILYETQEEVDEENTNHLVDYVIEAEYYSAEEAEAWNVEHADVIATDPSLVKHEGDEKTPSRTLHPGDDGYVPTYADGYPKHIGDVKAVIAAHYETNPESVPATTGTVKRNDITYPEATETTDPTYPATLEQLKTPAVYYTDDHGTPFVCPPLYQFSYNSSACLFAGLNAVYDTVQESNLSAPKWEANVHREYYNSTPYWVPVKGYRAEIMNVTLAGGTFFPEGAVFCGADLDLAGATVTGYIYNCYQGSPLQAITNIVPIPEY